MLLLAIAASAVCNGAVADAAQHRLGYLDVIAQQGKTLMRQGGMMMKSGGSASDASVATALAKMPYVQTVTLKLDGVMQPVILRRSFPAGDGGATSPTDVLFSIQPCRNVERDSEDANRVLCRDQNAAAPRFVFGRILLSPDRSVTASFSDGIIWTYSLNDPGPTMNVRR
jgi:hypothetical protein